MPSFFQVEHLTRHFGGLVALDEVSFEVERGMTFSIIGPNGAGKTTLFNCINGIYQPTSGTIAFQGEAIAGLKPHQIARRGLARTFQNLELFAHVTTMENLMLGRHLHMNTGLWRGATMLFRRSKAVREEIAHRQRVEQIIDLLDLHAARDKPVATLPYGTQKLVELGRALAMEPTLLLLDEPSAGMNQEEQEDLVFWLQDIKAEFGVTIVMIEHHMQMVMDISDRILVLNFGKPITEGTPEEVARHPEVIKAYLGDETEIVKREGVPGNVGAKLPYVLRSDPKTTDFEDSLEPLLTLKNVETYYDMVYALRGVSLEVREGTITTILGPNGAGKTTLLNTVMGLLNDQPDKGTITFRGTRIDGKDTEEIVRLGIGYVPEGREVFDELTVRENLMMGAYIRKDRAGIRQDRDRVYHYFPVLAERQKQLAGTLSGGEQQMLALGRALMNRPKLLFLDEPSLGLSPILVQEIFAIIETINREGMTILLVEQNARMALQIADDGLVLENGRFVTAGTAEALMQNEDIQEFYLGIKSEVSAKGYQRYKRKKRWR